jgi:hypothetical protein
VTPDPDTCLIAFIQEAFMLTVMIPRILPTILCYMVRLFHFPTLIHII